MPLDAITLTALRAELSEKLENARVDKIVQPERDEINLLLRTQSGHRRLVLSVGGNPRIHLTEQSRENPAVPPMFCMLLRKHLGAARLVEIRQPKLERILELCFETRDEMGERCEKVLVLELLGRMANLILRDGDGRILDCMRRLDLSSGQKRSLLPGFFYQLPPAQNKLDFMEPHCLETLWTGWEDRQEVAAQALLQQFNGLSPLCCREMVYRACGETDARIQEINPDRLQAAVDWLQTCVAEKDFQPVLLLENGQPRDFTFFVPHQYEGALEIQKMQSFSQLLEYFYEQRDRLAHQRQRAAELIKLVKNQRTRLSRKLDLQRQELEQARDREPLRRRGDLIMANLGQMNRGASVLHTVDFYDPEMREIDIPLDPRLSPQENAAYCYKTYTKRKNAEKILQQQLEQGVQELSYLESVMEELERAESARDFLEIREELQESGLLRKSKKEKKQGKPPALRPMAFQSSSGIRFWAGRNNRQNDLLTTKFAGKRDFWLHTQKIHGCHVIVEGDSGVPDETTLQEAAIVAATFSKASASSQVPVDYCPVRQVRKPRGAKPGMVIYENYKTMYVTPDPALAKRLEVAP